VRRSTWRGGESSNDELNRACARRIQVHIGLSCGGGSEQGRGLNVAAPFYCQREREITLGFDD
jgi:hypothetical protein